MKNKTVIMPDWKTIAKYLADESNSIETEMIDKWIKHSEKNRNEFNQIKNVWESTNTKNVQSKFNTDNAWNNLSDRMKQSASESTNNKKQEKVFFLKYLKYIAAILVVLIAIGIGWLYHANQTIIPENIFAISTSSKQIQKKELPDGTIVWLNENSEIKYSEDFDKESREITLKGQAFFDVAKNPAKPFIIESDKTTIEVLGTSFDVNAYPKNTRIEVTVESGRVKMSNNETTTKSEKEIVLVPGTIGRYMKKEHKLLYSKNINPNFRSWQTKQFVFKETSLNEVFKTIEKAYFIKIEANNNDFLQKRFSGSFSNTNIDIIVKTIAIAFNTEIEKNETTIRFIDKSQ